MLSPLGLMPQTMIYPEIVIASENTVTSSVSKTTCFVRSKPLLMSPPYPTSQIIKQKKQKQHKTKKQEQ